MMSDKVETSSIMRSFAAFKWIVGTPSGNHSIHLGRSSGRGSFLFLHAQMKMTTQATGEHPQTSQNCADQTHLPALHLS